MERRWTNVLYCRFPSFWIAHFCYSFCWQLISYRFWYLISRLFLFVYFMSDAYSHSFILQTKCSCLLKTSLMDLPYLPVPCDAKLVNERAVARRFLL